MSPITILILKLPKRKSRRYGFLTMVVTHAQFADRILLFGTDVITAEIPIYQPVEVASEPIVEKPVVKQALPPKPLKSAKLGSQSGAVKLRSDEELKVPLSLPPPIPKLPSNVPPPIPQSAPPPPVTEAPPVPLPQQQLSPKGPENIATVSKSRSRIAPPPPPVGAPVEVISVPSLPLAPPPPSRDAQTPVVKLSSGPPPPPPPPIKSVVVNEPVDDPMRKYKKMLEMLPQGAVYQKMIADALKSIERSPPPPKKISLLDEIQSGSKLKSVQKDDTRMKSPAIQGVGGLLGMLASKMSERRFNMKVEDEDDDSDSSGFSDSDSDSDDDN
eukprot:gene26024-32549_t